MKILDTLHNDNLEVSTASGRWLPQQPVKVSHLTVVFCTCGTAEVELDARSFQLMPHSQLVVLPGSILQAIAVSDDCGLLRIACSERIFHDMSGNLDPAFFNFLRRTPCVSLPDGEAQLLLQLANLMQASCADSDNCYRTQMSYNYMQNLLYHFYNRTHRFFSGHATRRENRKEELFKQFVKLVHHHAHERRDVGFYAGQMHITPRYLSILVMSASGETAKSIIDRHVVAEAKVLLKNTRLTVQEVAGRLQFSNQSFFGRYFKKHTGLSPLQYRNMA